MSKLVPSTGCLHRGQTLKLTFLLIQYPKIIEHYSTEIILLFLTTAHVDLIKNLNGGKFAGHFINMSEVDLNGLLGGQLMDINMAVFFIPVMKAGFF